MSVFDQLEDERSKALARAYRSMDKTLLDDMLIDLHFITEATNEGEQALNNYAKILLGKVYAPEIQPETFWGLVKRLTRRTK